MPTQTELTNNLIAAATSLKTTFEGKRDEIDTAVDTAIDALDTAKANIVADEAATAASRANVEADETAVAASKAQVDSDAAAIATAIGDIEASIMPKLPLFNIIPDGGRFVDNTNDEYLNGVSGGFTAARSLEYPYNGSVISDGGKFIRNNTTYGGSAGALPASVIDLLTAQGRAGEALRYGPEFHIAEITAGTGTGTTPRQGHYLMNSANGYGAFQSMYNKVSFAAWVRLTSGTAWIYNVGSTLIIDGVDSASVEKEMSIADGWIHVAGNSGSSLGYISHGLPSLYGLDGTVVELALPVFVPGTVDLPIHTQPLPAFKRT